MKPIRQLYLGLFLVYGIALALLFFSSMRVPNLFGTMGAGITVSVIAQIIRSRKEGVTFPRLLPSILAALICLSHVAALFILGGTAVTRDSAAFLFYLITSLGNMVLSAVGFFLKQTKKMPVD